MSHHTKLHLYGIMVCNYKEPQISIYYDYTVLPQLPIMQTISMCHHIMLRCLLLFLASMAMQCFLHLSHKQLDVIITIHRSSCKVLFLSNFNQTWICSTGLVKNPKHKISKPSGQWEMSLQNGETDKQDNNNNYPLQLFFKNN
jgi:hypothetical protein